MFFQRPKKFFVGKDAPRGIVQDEMKDNKTVNMSRGFVNASMGKVVPCVDLSVRSTRRGRPAGQGDHGGRHRAEEVVQAMGDRGLLPIRIDATSERMPILWG